MVLPKSLLIQGCQSISSSILLIYTDTFTTHQVTQIPTQWSKSWPLSEALDNDHFISLQVKTLHEVWIMDYAYFSEEWQIKCLDYSGYSSETKSILHTLCFPLNVDEVHMFKSSQVTSRPVLCKLHLPEMPVCPVVHVAWANPAFLISCQAWSMTGRKW